MLVYPGEVLVSNNAFETYGENTMGIELAADGMEIVFKPFKVFLCRDVWEKFVEHMFEGDVEDDETSGWWFACDKRLFHQ